MLRTGRTLRAKLTARVGDYLVCPMHRCLGCHQDHTPDAEVEIATKFSAAAGIYHENATALQLRSLNLLYEGMKERGTLMIIPSSMADSMGAGSYAGIAALAAQHAAANK